MNMLFQNQPLRSVGEGYTNIFRDPRKSQTGSTEKYSGPEKIHPESVVGTCFSADSRAKNYSGKFGRKDCLYSSQGWLLWLRLVGSSLGRIAFRTVSALGTASVRNTWQSIFKSGLLWISSMPTISSIQCLSIFPVSFVGHVAKEDSEDINPGCHDECWTPKIDTIPTNQKSNRQIHHTS